MPQINKILVSDVEYKHATALIKGIKSCYPNVHITGQVSEKRSSIFVSKLVDSLFIGPLDQALKNDKYDIIIPVSGGATQFISKQKMTEVFLASSEQISSALDKYELSTTCNMLGMTYPKTEKFKHIDDLKNFGFPCVVKSRNETLSKFDTVYFDNAETFDNLYDKIEKLLFEHSELILQERVRAKISRGFFALCSNGQILCEFMHERVRQWPRSGGSSTSAKGINCVKLQHLSGRFLRDLEWTGPVMLEYLYDEVEDAYTLIEINPKFWGSLDLAINSGVNFGSALLDAKFGKPVTRYNYSLIQTSWPLDGDLVNLVQTGNFLGFLSYFDRNHHLVWGESIKSIIIKFLWTLKKLTHVS